MPPQRPWYFETPGPSLVNEWTIVHFATGALWAARKPNALLTGLAGHTAYETIEGQLFPVEDRDVSMRNHVGDSLAFLAGMLIARWVRR